MKLVHQINLAFGILLVLVLTVTAISIHFVLLDHFIGAQKDDMHAVGWKMQETLEQEAYQLTEGVSAVNVTPRLLSSSTAAIAAVPIVGVDAIITDNMGNIVSGTLPAASSTSITGFKAVNAVTAVSPLSLTRAATTVDTTLQETTNVPSLQNIWEGRDARFIATVNAIPKVH